MRYYGDIYRPPSEAYSLIVQATIGCSHNKCTFCDMYRDKKFKVRNVDEVIEDLNDSRKKYRFVNRIFLADGDALIMKMKDLTLILDFIKKTFPECERVATYASPRSVILKTDEELKILYEKGLYIAYIGLESGSDKVLKDINKGETADEIVNCGLRLKKAGIKVSVTAILGLAGKDGSKEHAIATGKAFSHMKPDYIGLLTLFVRGDTPIKREIESGRFKVLSPKEILEETLLIVKNTDSDGTVIRSNHASNYISLRGTLNADKEQMIKEMEEILQSETDEYKAEFLRRL